MKRPGYVAYGVVVLLLVAAAEAFGWGMTTRSEVKDIPTTVRSNPGSYRSHYIHTGTIRRGK